MINENKNNKNNKPVVVYTFVVGDLFHANHVRFLELARTFGDKLIVGVLSDLAVSSYKRKPIYSLTDRLLIVSSLKFVDMTVVQYSRSPLEVAKILLPNIIVHADDWKSNLPDKEEIESLGIEIKFTQYFEGTSTTKAIEKCKTVTK